MFFRVLSTWSCNLPQKETHQPHWATCHNALLPSCPESLIRYALSLSWVSSLDFYSDSALVTDVRVQVLIQKNSWVPVHWNKWDFSRVWNYASASRFAVSRSNLTGPSKCCLETSEVLVWQNCVVPSSQDMLFRAQMGTMWYKPCFYFGCNQVRETF